MFAFVLLSILPVTVAYPSYWNCDWNCLSAISAGDAFGNGGIDSFSTVSGSASCSISISGSDGQITSFTEGTEYTITVSMASSTGETLMAYGLTSDETSFDSSSRDNSYIATWTGTSDIEMQFRAACGAMGSTDEIYISDIVTLSKATDTTDATCCNGDCGAGGDGDCGQNLGTYWQCDGCNCKDYSDASATPGVCNSTNSEAAESETTETTPSITDTTSSTDATCCNGDCGEGGDGDCGQNLGTYWQCDDCNCKDYSDASATPGVCDSTNSEAAESETTVLITAEVTISGLTEESFTDDVKDGLIAAFASAAGMSDASSIEILTYEFVAVTTTTTTAPSDTSARRLMTSSATELLLIIEFGITVEGADSGAAHALADAVVDAITGDDFVAELVATAETLGLEVEIEVGSISTQEITSASDDTWIDGACTSAPAIMAVALIVIASLF